jgi:type I restriction enzyme R subunit
MQLDSSGLIKKYQEANCEDKEILVTINKAISSSIELRSKKDLIEEFIASLNKDSDVYEDFNKFMNSKKKEELDRIIKEENLDKEKTYNYIKKSFENGNLETVGTDIVSILPPISMFSDNNERGIRKKNVIEKLSEYFNRFFNLSNRDFND